MNENEVKTCPLLLAAYAIQNGIYNLRIASVMAACSCRGCSCAWWKRNPAYNAPGSSPDAPEGYCAIVKTGGRE